MRIGRRIGFILIGLVMGLLVLGMNGSLSASITTLDFPGGSSTCAFGISGNKVVGKYYQNNRDNGFLYDGMNFISIIPPGSIYTQAFGVSENYVVGLHRQGGRDHGFLYDGTSFTTIDVPGSLGGSAWGISDGNIVGSYADSGNTAHGFLYDGTNYTTIDVPGALWTQALSISGNNIVGNYRDISGDHGYLYDGTSFTIIDVPGALWTQARGISGNNIVGNYDDGNGYKSYFYDGTTYIKLKVPGSSLTKALGIWENKVVGYYSNSSGIHGFVATIDDLRDGYVVTPTPNRPPVLAPIGDRQVEEGATLQFMIEGSDPDGNALSYSASNLPTGATFDPASRTFSWTPTFEQSGLYPNILFTVTDTGTPPLSASEAITITVGNVNRAPVLAPIGNKQGKENEPISFEVTASDPDTANVLSFQVSNMPVGATFTFQPGNPASGLFTWTPTYGQARSYQNIIFTVMDDDPDKPTQDTEAITIVIDDVNRPPELMPIGNKTAREGELLEFTIVATDPDGDPLVFAADKLPDGALFDTGSQKFSWTPGFDQAGEYPNIAFSISDVPNEASDTLVDVEVITITVGDVPRAPVFSPIGAQRGLEGETLRFNILATDPDGNLVIYSSETLPGGASLDAQTGSFVWTPGSTQAGAYTVTFSASDNCEPPQVTNIEVVITIGDVPTIFELVDNLVTAINSLGLPKAVLNSYVANAKKVAEFIKQSKVTPAINQLRTFIQKVEQDTQKGTVTQADSARLIAMADEIIIRLTQ